MTADKAGSYVAPFERLHGVRTDLEVVTKSEAEGEWDVYRFWHWVHVLVTEPIVYAEPLLRKVMVLCRCSCYLGVS